MPPKTFRVVLGALLLSSSAAAQAPAFTSPGMPVRSGQINRFTADFNPAIGVVIDALADWVDQDGTDDGLDADLRTFELNLNANVDPSWWAYAVVVADSEEVELEEAAANYIGFEGNTTVRVGQFFVDFGKQMQAHVHDLPYPERPPVLSEFLGTELPGVGAQVDHWWATGESSALRASFGVFADLGTDHEHGEEDEEQEGAELVIGDRQRADELALTARVTQFMDAGQNGVFQWGLSARHLPDFAFEDDDNEVTADGLSNTVLGLDLTYGVDSNDGLSGWTVGGEYLLNDGDLAAAYNDKSATLEVFDDDVAGYYLWGERRFDQQHSAGLLLGSFEHAEPGTPDQSEITAYYTFHMTEFSRLRLALSHTDFEEEEDATRFTVQLTTFFGAHAHGLNW